MSASSRQIAQSVYALLWPEAPPSSRGLSPPAVYALLDAARDERIFEGLVKHQDDIQVASLYQGQLAEDLAAVAPYIVLLQPRHPFTDWLIASGWGQSWGLFVQARLDFDEMRRHFRKFTVVWTETGKSLIFRFYDPRVLRIFLPTCTPDDLRKLFGPVERFIVEDEVPVIARCLEHRNGTLVSLPAALVPDAVPAGELIRP